MAWPVLSGGWSRCSVSCLRLLLPEAAPSATPCLSPRVICVGRFQIPRGVRSACLSFCVWQVSLSVRPSRPAPVVEWTVTCRSSGSGIFRRYKHSFPSGRPQGSHLGCYSSRRRGHASTETLLIKNVLVGLYPQAPLCMEVSRPQSWSGQPFPSAGDPDPGMKRCGRVFAARAAWGALLLGGLLAVGLAFSEEAPRAAPARGCTSSRCCRRHSFLHVCCS